VGVLGSTSYPDFACRLAVYVRGLEKTLVISTKVGDHSFVASGFGPRSVVLDLGLNSGHWALAMIEAFGCTVYGVEPVPWLFESLPSNERLIAEHCAVTASSDGTVTLFLNDQLDATIRHSIADDCARSLDVPARTLGSIVHQFGLDRIDLLKIDVEGAEVDILLDSPQDVLERANQITVEFHDWLDPSLASGVRDTFARLRSLGFQMFRFSRTNGDVLFVRPALAVPASLVVTVEKYRRGVLRILRRAVNG
jgi:FkbM family methyltransferase